MTSPFRKNKLAVAGLVIVAALTFVAVFAPWLAPYDPANQQLMDRLDGPSWQHPFGNDELGRDILSTLLLGTRVSMRVGATVVLLWWSSILCWPSPEVLFAIVLVAFLGPGLDRLIFALASIGWVG